MILCGNNIAKEYLDHFFTKQTEKNFESQETNKILYETHLSNLDSSYLNSSNFKKESADFLVNNTDFQSQTINFFKNLFEKQDIKSEITNLRNFIKNIQSSNLDVVPYSGYNDPNQGVHVEAKGVVFLIKKFETYKVFNVGLAAVRSEDPFFDKHPGCCAGCSAEFKIMTKYNYIINRIGDYEQNSPRDCNAYKPSANITSDNLVFKRFIDLLHERNLNDFANSLSNKVEILTGQRLIQEDDLPSLLYEDTLTLAGLDSI